MLDGWTTAASGGVLWWGAFQVSPFPSRLWVDPELCQHPAKRYTHAAQVIRGGKKEKKTKTKPLSYSTHSDGGACEILKVDSCHITRCAHTWRRFSSVGAHGIAECVQTWPVSLNRRPGASGQASRSGNVWYEQQWRRKRKIILFLN